MLKRFIRWFKRVIIGEEEPEEICETMVMSEEERKKIMEEAQNDLWDNV